MDAAAPLIARLREDLKTAMRARASEETAVLRALLGALDNAQAVPLDPDHKPAEMRRFGDGSAEVSRRVLNTRDVDALLAREAEERDQAAGEMERLGQTERAAALRGEAAIVRRYRPAAI